MGTPHFHQWGTVMLQCVCLCVLAGVEVTPERTNLQVKCVSVVVLSPSLITVSSSSGFDLVYLYVFVLIFSICDVVLCKISGFPFRGLLC